jgi:hypothetical protein
MGKALRHSTAWHFHRAAAEESRYEGRLLPSRTRERRHVRGARVGETWDGFGTDLSGRSRPCWPHEAQQREWCYEVNGPIQVAWHPDVATMVCVNFDSLRAYGIDARRGDSRVGGGCSYLRSRSRQSIVGWLP